MTDPRVVFYGQELIDSIRNPESLPAMPLRRLDALLRVCRRANLLGKLAEGIHAAGLEEHMPLPVRPHLLSARMLTAHQRDAIGWEIRHIGLALQNLNAPVILLKGAAYAIRGLQAAQGRLFSDVDILVDRAMLNHTEAALMVGGWAGDYHDPYDDRYYREWMHEIPPMTHRSRGTVIDVHHNILPTTARNCPDPKLLVAAAKPIPGTVFHTLCPVDIVIHSATHLFHESELQNGLRDLFDLDALLLQFALQSTTFWTDLVDRAIQLKLEIPLVLALRCTSTILATAVPDDLVPRLKESAGLRDISVHMLDAIYLRALMPDHLLSRNWQESIARACVYLRGHSLRMPPAMLVRHLGRKSLLRLFRNTSRST